MSKNKFSKDKAKGLSPRTTTVVESDTANVLLPMEEKLIRMLHGLSEPDDHVLQFAVGATTETKLRLALIEKELHLLFCGDSRG